MSEGVRNGVSFEGTTKDLRAMRDELRAKGLAWEQHFSIEESKKLGYLYLHTDYEGRNGNMGMREHISKNTHFKLPEDFQEGFELARVKFSNLVK
jgi:hypothetical protein